MESRMLMKVAGSTKTKIEHYLLGWKTSAVNLRRISIRDAENVQEKMVTHFMDCLTVGSVGLAILVKIT